jgi:hypothetical protein
MMIIHRSAYERASTHGPAAYVGYTGESRGLSLPYGFPFLFFSF